MSHTLHFCGKLGNAGACRLATVYLPRILFVAGLCWIGASTVRSHSPYSNETVPAEMAAALDVESMLPAMPVTDFATSKWYFCGLPFMVEMRRVSDGEIDAALDLSELATSTPPHQRSLLPDTTPICQRLDQEGQVQCEVAGCGSDLARAMAAWQDSGWNVRNAPWSGEECQVMLCESKTECLQVMPFYNSGDGRWLLLLIRLPGMLNSSHRAAR